MVYHKHKNKVIVVYDCAARLESISLNNLLMLGPDLTKILLSVLMKFRLGKYAHSSDIAKMFFQVKVPETDRLFTISMVA